MAKCHICNAKLDVVEVDERDGRIKPCGDCQDEIDDAVYELDEELDFDPFEDKLELWDPYEH